MTWRAGQSQSERPPNPGAPAIVRVMNKIRVGTIDAITSITNDVGAILKDSGGTAIDSTNPVPTTLYDASGNEWPSSADVDRVAIANGDAPNRMHLRKFGARAGIDTTYRTVNLHAGEAQPNGGFVYLWSSSANDTAAGTGLHAATIYGLAKTTLALQSETLATNGTTEVKSVNEYECIFRITPGAVGGSGTLVGVLDVGATGKGTVYARIQASGTEYEGQTQMAWYQVPAGYNLILDSAYAKIVDTTKVGTARLEYKAVGSIWRNIATWSIAAGSNDPYPLWDTIPPKAIVRLQCKVSVSTATFLGDFTGTLVPVPT